MAEELNAKYFPSETRVMQRSEIHLSGYNPRQIDPEGKKQLARSIRNFGVVGGIVVNAQTGYTVVSGHQKIKILDEKFGYPENDYSLKVEVVDVDEKTEKEMNIMFNNPNVGGKWDYDALAQLVPDIDFKKAGLTDSDLSLIGLDYIFKTEGENDISAALEELGRPAEELLERERERKKAERKVAKEAESPEPDVDDIESYETEEDSEPTYEEKKAHMKEVKEIVKQNAIEQAGKADAYIMLSFDTLEAKCAFLERFGYPADIRFIKGEDFDEVVEAVI